MLVKFVFADDFVGHGYAERLHWVSVGVVVGPDHLIEVVDDVLLRTHLKIITLQTKIIYSQLYNPMDEDEFNDF